MENKNKNITKHKNNLPSKSNKIKPAGNESVSVGIPRNAAAEAKRSARPVMSSKSIKKRNKAASKMTAIRVPTETVSRKNKKDKKPLPIAGIFASIILTVLFLFMIMNFAEIDKYNSEIAEMNNTYTKLQTEAAKLQGKLDKKDDLNFITEYAKNNLGMVKQESAQNEYVDLSPDNIILLENRQKPTNEGFGILMSGFSEVIKNFLTKE